MKKKYIITIILLTILDQVSKFFIDSSLNLYEKIVIIKDFFCFEYVQNTGISFGLFSGSRILIIILTLFIICFMTYELLHIKDKFYNFSCLLIISGALGNLIDRIVKGYVVDFISFTIFNHKMAIFNFADILIVTGIFLYILLMVMEGRNENEKNTSR